MLVLSVRGKETQLRAAIKKHRDLVDLIEWRLDLIEGVNRQTFDQLKREACLPSIFKVGPIDSSEKEEELLEVLSLSPTYLDLPWTTPPPFIEKIRARYPLLRLIASYHHFTETPSDLDTIFSAMACRFPNAIIKIATTACSSLDALRMLLFVYQKRKQGSLLAGVCMGRLGLITRILGPVVNNLFTYVAAEPGEETASCQLLLDELVRIYRIKTLTTKTSIYALIGNPLFRSVGHLCHNAFFHQVGSKSVYVKIELSIEELPFALNLMRALPFQGLSVTMPLKEAVAPYLDQLDHDAEQIGAVNTIKREGRQWIGYNTDAKAALNAIEKELKVKGKTVLILGAGGVARAIAVEAALRGGHLLIFNRTEVKAMALAEKLKSSARVINAAQLAKEHYDILVNATSVGMEPNAHASPIDPKNILPKTLVFDAIAHPKTTQLIAAAKAKGCRCIDGTTLYAEQAAGQLAIWLSTSVKKESIFAHMP